MYEHVREVTVGLILILAFTAIAAVVALIDPFNNGVPWANWLSMSLAAILAIITSTIIVANADNDGDFWDWLLRLVIGWFLSGGILFGMVVGANSIRPEYHPLVWTVFAIPLAVLPLAALVQYLAGAAASRRGSSASLRRVA